ncbi:MAG: phospho-sugar mutase [Bacilli bacterium]
MNYWKDIINLDSKLKKELLSLSEEELKEAFYQDLEFGTGGLRGIVGVGTNRLNIYTLKKTNIAYSKYLLSNFDNPSAVIAYDSRNMSLEFAIASATTLANFGIKVYLFNKITPTPVLSFAIRHLKASGGIIITASHNPPEYNGYKVYDEEGCQLVPSKVDHLLEFMKEEVDVFNYDIGNYQELIKENMIVFLDEEVDDEYVKRVLDISVNKDLKKDIKIVYTPLHGTGKYLGERLLKELGYDYFCVPEQMIPDPLFSTVKSPNPESNLAFEYAVKYGQEFKSDLLIATDPDADRLGIAIRVNDSYHFLTGNEVGAILIYYLCNYRPLENGVLFNTIVTSDIGSKIAKSFNLDVVSTLTGFKFIGEAAKKLEATNKKFFFGYEESYGYVISDFVRDKDALQALTLISEVVQFYKNKNMNLLDVLEEIYNKFGYCSDDLVNIVLPGLSGNLVIKEIMNYFRDNDLDFTEVNVKEDYLLQQRIFNGQTEKIDLPKSNVIKFILKDGSWFVLRPSGTEPKLKIYLCSYGKSRIDANKNTEYIKKNLLDVIERLKK